MDTSTKLNWKAAHAFISINFWIVCSLALSPLAAHGGGATTLEGALSAAAKVSAEHLPFAREFKLLSESIDLFSAREIALSERIRNHGFLLPKVEQGIVSGEELVKFDEEADAILAETLALSKEHEAFYARLAELSAPHKGPAASANASLTSSIEGLAERLKKINRPAQSETQISATVKEKPAALETGTEPVSPLEVSSTNAVPARDPK